MIPPLPPVRTFSQHCRHEDAWTDHYGALHVAAAYAGWTPPVRYCVEGMWQHGCLGPWEAVTPGAVAFNAPGAQGRPVYVSRQEEADYLIANGYPQARAIGMPIIYTAPSSVARVPRSLLVMPTHSLVGDAFPDRSAFVRYADEVRQFAADFEHVTVCIHPSCQRNGLWIPEFKERGIDMVLGAQTNDANALARMRALFEQYETVTTNGWGSHIAYALAFGARVAWHGTRPAFDVNNLLRDKTWAADVRSLELTLADECQNQQRKFLREFMVPPVAAVANRPLGEWLVGAVHRLPPAELAQVLQTLVVPVIDPRDALRESREESRRAAAALAAGGRRAAAINAYVNVAVAAANAKNAPHMHETLLLLAGDLGSLDPARSKLIRQQAEVLASRLAARSAA
jgi:hypothetical protein